MLKVTPPHWFELWIFYGSPSSWKRATITNLSRDLFDVKLRTLTVAVLLFGMVEVFFGADERTFWVSEYMTEKGVVYETVVNRRGFDAAMAFDPSKELAPISTIDALKLAKIQLGEVFGDAKFSVREISLTMIYDVSAEVRWVYVIAFSESVSMEKFLSETIPFRSRTVRCVVLNKDLVAPMQIRN